MTVGVVALVALGVASAWAGVEFVTPINMCRAKVDEIGDGKDLFIIAGPNVQFEVFGNSIDLIDPNSGLRIATDSGAGSVTARILHKHSGSSNKDRGCGDIGSAEVEVDSPIDLTSNVQRSLFFRMPLGDESRLQMTIKAYPVINSVTWTSSQSDVDCVVKAGTLERLEQDHKMRIRLPPGHRLDNSSCSSQMLVALVSANIGELDIPYGGSAAISGWAGFTYAVTGAPAFLQPSQIPTWVLQYPRDIYFGINVLAIRSLTGASNSTITVRSPNPNAGTGTLTLEVIPEPAPELRPQVPDMPGATLTFTPPSPIGGSSVTGKVSISNPAPAGGLPVNLSSSTPALAAVPPSVTIAAGSTSTSFAVTTIPVPGAMVVPITATTLLGTVTTSLSIMPAVLSSVTVTPASVSAGQTTTGQVTLNGRAPAGGRQIQLSINSPGLVAFVPPSVTVAQGATTASFEVQTSAFVMVSTDVTITASVGGMSRTVKLTVHP